MRAIRSEFTANSALRESQLRHAYVARRAADEPVRAIFGPDLRTEEQKAADLLRVRGILRACEFQAMLTPEASARIASAVTRAKEA